MIEGWKGLTLKHAPTVETTHDGQGIETGVVDGTLFP